MPSRQEALLDAAIVILGNAGIRRLTHRAVDAGAGVPAGSASNYFKSREALVAAVVDRFAARERAAWEAIAGLIQPASRHELAAALAAYVRRAIGPDRDLTVARYSLFIEAALHPELQPALSGAARAIQAWGAHWLEALGATDPLGECRSVLDQIEGILLHQLAFPDPTIDLDQKIAVAVRALTTVP